MVTTLMETKLEEIPEDWGVTTIGECCSILDSQRVPLSAEVRRDMKGDYPYYGANGQLDSIDKWIFDEPLILMAEDGGYFDDFRNRPIAYKVTGKCWVNNHAHVLRLKQAYWFDWVFYQLEHMNIIPYINGSTRAKLNQQELVQIRLPVAPLPEQRKIAEILSTVDEAIEKTDAIIRETQQLKKGLMQKLFTEGIGHTKFKETKIGRIEYGTIPVDWDEVELNSICNVTSSKRIMMHEYVDSGIPFYRTKEIIEKMRGISHDKILYISESRFQEISRKFGAPQNGDILITAVGSLGVPYLIEDDERFYFKDGNLLWLRNFSGEIDKRFLIYYFESFGFKKVIEVITAGSSQKALTIEKLEKLGIPLPNSSEQQMITQILSEVDVKIEKEQDFKSELEQLKTGLMQVLLTGKARVKV